MLQKCNFFFLFFPPSCSERGTRRGSPAGQREAKEGTQAPDHLLQLPAGRPAEEIPVSPVSGPAGAGRAGRTAGPHADAGKTSGMITSADQAWIPEVPAGVEALMGCEVSREVEALKVFHIQIFPPEVSLHVSC